MRWQSKEEIMKTTETAGAVTAEPLSFEWGHYGHPQLVRVETTFSAVTNAGTQTVILQQNVGGAWATLKESSAFTAAGVVTILLNTDTADKLLVPVSGTMRLVLKQTNAGDKATATSVKVFQFS